MGEIVSAKIGGLSLIALMVLLVLRQIKPEWGVLVRMAAAVTVASVSVTMIASVLAFASELAGVGGGMVDGEAWGILLKSLGVAFVTEIAASICRDSGEGGLAGWVEMAGRVEILLLSFPLIRTVLGTVTDLLGGR